VTTGLIGTSGTFTIAGNGFIEWSIICTSDGDTGKFNITTKRFGGAQSSDIQINQPSGTTDLTIAADFDVKLINIGLGSPGVSPGSTVAPLTIGVSKIS
jgi:hypothetical protein